MIFAENMHSALKQSVRSNVLIHQLLLYTFYIIFTCED